MLPERQGTLVVSLKCLLKTGAHPRGGFQGPCKPLRAHAARVFRRGGMAAAGSAESPLGTGLPASDGEVLGVKHVIFMLFLCWPHCGVWLWRSRCAASWALPRSGWSPGSQQHTGTALLRLPEPTALPPLGALPAHPEPRSSDTTPWKPDLQAAVSCLCY